MVIDKQKGMEGLKIISGDLLPVGYIFTGDSAEDKEQERQMVKWLNDTETRQGYTTLEGGAFYGYVAEMAKRIYEALKE